MAPSSVHHGNGVYYDVLRVVNGQEQPIAGAAFHVYGGGDRDYRMEVEGQTYRIFQEWGATNNYLPIQLLSTVARLGHERAFELGGIEIKDLP